MRTKIYVFKENNITFTLDKDNKVMVNATEMAKAHNKDVKDFMLGEKTKDFIKSCLKEDNPLLLNIEKEEDLISLQQSDVWMHEIIARKFAEWFARMNVIKLPMKDSISLLCMLI